MSKLVKTGLTLAAGGLVIHLSHGWSKPVEVFCTAPTLPACGAGAGRGTISTIARIGDRCGLDIVVRLYVEQHVHRCGDRRGTPHSAEPLREHHKAVLDPRELRSALWCDERRQINTEEFRLDPAASARREHMDRREPPSGSLTIAIYGYMAEKVTSCSRRCHGSGSTPFDCSSLRSEQVALTSFGPLPRW